MKISSVGRIARYQIVFVLLIFALIGALVFSINSGSVEMSVKDIIKIIVFRAQEGSVESNVIWKSGCRV